MPIVKPKDIRNMKADEIQSKLYEIKLELSKEMGNVKMGRPVKNNGRIKELKRTVARILTIKQEIKNKEVKQKNA